MIKKISIIIYMCTISIFAFGQIQKGNFIIDGGFNAQLATILTLVPTNNLQTTIRGDNIISNGSLSERNKNIFNFHINPTIAYFISSKTALGGGLTLAREGQTPYTYYGLNGSVRQYFKPQGKFNGFIEANIGFLSSEDHIWFDGNINLGLDIFLSPNIAWESKLIFLLPTGNTNSVGNATALHFGSSLKIFLSEKALKFKENKVNTLQKKTFFLGLSSVKIQFASARNGSYNTVYLDPTFGLFLSDRWVVGGRLLLENDHQKTIRYNDFNLGLIPFTRFYVSDDDKRIAFFSELGLGGTFSRLSINPRISNISTENPQKRINLSAFGSLGFNYFISPLSAFEVKMKYQYLEGINALIRKKIVFDVGFQFFLKPKKEE